MTNSPPSSPKASPPSKPKPNANILLGKSDRLFAVGKTGSGKTFGVKHLLRLKAKRKPVAIVADFKWTGDDSAGSPIPFAKDGPGTVDVPRKVNKFDPRHHVQLVEPKVPGYNDEALQAFFRDCMKFAAKSTTGLVVYVDEAFRVCDQHHNPPAFSDLWTNGRKYKLEAWAGSQFPAKLPDELMSQAELWLIFRVINPIHLKKISEFVGAPKVRTVRLPNYYFFQWNQTDDDVQLMKPFPAPTQKGGTGNVSNQKRRG